jgi:hypothetical protein
MVRDGIRMSGLRLGAANISFKLFERCFNLPPGSIIFDNFLNRKGQVGGKKRNPLGFAIDPYDLDRTFQRFEHHYALIGYNGSDAPVKIYIVLGCKAPVFHGHR